jgi:hypothetical protein
MTEKSGKEIGRERLSVKVKVAAACIVAVIVVAGLGAWLINQGHSGTPAGPAIEFEREPGTALTFVVSNIDPPDGVTWNDKWMKLEARPTAPNASYTYKYWEWHPSTDLLTSQHGETVIQSIDFPSSTSPNQIVCNVTDIAGNGCINVGDFFVLFIMGNEVDVQGVPLEILVFYGGTPLWTMHFQIGTEARNSKDLVSTIMKDPLIIGAVVVVILVLLVWLVFVLRRREKPAPVEQEVMEAQPPG